MAREPERKRSEARWAASARGLGLGAIGGPVGPPPL